MSSNVPNDPLLAQKWPKFLQISLNEYKIAQMTLISLNELKRG